MGLNKIKEEVIKMGKKESGFLIAVAVIVVAFVINQSLGNVLGSWFNPPNVVNIVDSDTRHFCPDRIYFSSYPSTSDFKVTYKNNGGDGNLITTTKSSKVLFQDENGNLKNEDSIDWIFDSGKETTRTYHIALNYTYYDQPDNLTINVTYLCYQKTPFSNTCGAGLKCCNYEKSSSSSYTLVNELC